MFARRKGGGRLGPVVGVSVWMTEGNGKQEIAEIGRREKLHLKILSQCLAAVLSRFRASAELLFCAYVTTHTVGASLKGSTPRGGRRRWCVVVVVIMMSHVQAKVAS